VTPAERVVVEAALRWHADMADELNAAELYGAVDALLAERADPATPTEQDITWGQVVVGDEIYSDKTRRWYEVTNTVILGSDTGRVKIHVKGLPEPIEPKLIAPVTVRRSEMGKAVDMFASVLWSGQALPDQPAATEPELAVEVPDA
jgi:hypothetical protein